MPCYIPHNMSCNMPFTHILCDISCNMLLNNQCNIWCNKVVWHAFNKIMSFHEFSFLYLPMEISTSYLLSMVIFASFQPLNFLSQDGATINRFSPVILLHWKHQFLSLQTFSFLLLDSAITELSCLLPTMKKVIQYIEYYVDLLNIWIHWC